MEDSGGLPGRWALDPRIAVRNDRPYDREGDCVVYWMQRAQRAKDDPALDAAIEAADELGKPLAVFFALIPSFPGACERHFAFLLDGLPETAKGIERRGAAFVLRTARSRDPAGDVVRFSREMKASLVVGDGNPLREPERWRREAASRLRIPFSTVDADGVVPTSRKFRLKGYLERVSRLAKDRGAPLEGTR